MNEIKSVELYLENTEIIYLETINIDALDLINSNCSSADFASKEIRISVEELFLKISAKANTLAAYRDGFPMENRSLPFDRIIRCNDITSVTIEYNNNISKSICPNWGGERYEYNLYQTSMIDESDNLQILISPKRTCTD